MKTTSFIKGLAIATAAVFFGSCQQLYIDTQPEVETRMSTDVRESYTFSGTNPQPATFSIGSTTPWEITGYEAADWLSVKPASSALSSLSADVTLTAVPNDTYEQRSVTLTLKGEGIDKVWTIQVVQGMKSKFYVQPITAEFEGAGNSLAFSVETNLAWEVRSADAWLTFDKTSGTGTGAIETITATAAENPGTERTTTVTVTAGAETETFTVIQKGGKALEFLTTEVEMISYAGGEVLLDVNASMDWTVASSAEWLTVEKVGAQVKATAAASNAFAARTAVVTIAGDGLTAEVELTQDTPFELKNAEVLEDGSVKLDGANGARINIKEGLRYFSAHISIKEISFGSEGQFWFFSETDGDFGNWMSVGKLRLRTNNGAVSNYNNTVYTDELSTETMSATTKYDFTVTPDAETPGNGKFIFEVDNFTKESHSWLSPFAGTETTFNWWFGFYSSVSDGSYYVIDSCTITPIAE